MVSMIFLWLSVLLGNIAQECIDFHLCIWLTLLSKVICFVFKV